MTATCRRNVVEVAAGDSHTCARLTSGQVRCWGENTYGEVGDGTFVDRLRPRVVKAASGSGRLTGALRLGNTGGAHTCAVFAGGQIQCWGRNVDGGLGTGDTDDSPLPVSVLDPTGTIPLSNAAQVSGGAVFTCARLSNGQARCWGDNPHGQLGNGTTDEHHLPVVVQL